MSRWNHSICRRCWAEREGARAPVCLREPPVERCCFCGHVADEGIYVRHDPEALACRGEHGKKPLRAPEGGGA